MMDGTDQPREPASGRKLRPYWHVDAKWVSGLLFALAWTLTLLALTAYQLTQPEPASTIGGNLLASMTATGDGGDEPDDSVGEFIAQVEVAGPGGLQPIPGMEATITVDDLARFTPDELRVHLFTQVAEQVYWEGAETAEASGETALSSLGLMALLTNETHLQIGSALLSLAAADLLLLLLLVAFSAGWGRLASPGVVLLMAGLPGAALLTPLTLGVRQTLTASSGGDGAGLAAMGQLAGPALIPAAEVAMRIWLASALVGGLLLALAIVGGLARRGRRAIS
jgi:hypothetical protein